MTKMQSVRRVVRCELTQQKESCLEPVALDRARRDAEQLGNLAFAESAKEAELDDLAKPFVDRVEPIQRVVDRDDLVELNFERRVAVAQGDASRDAAALRGA